MPKVKIQVEVDPLTGALSPRYRTKYTKYRMMALQPTIRLAKKFAGAAIQSAGWKYEGDIPEHVNFLEKALDPFQSVILRTSTAGQFDFGWKAYEKVFEAKLVEGFGLRQMLQKLTPLRNDDTEVVIDQDGVFQGLLWRHRVSGQPVLIDQDHSLWLNFEEEGYGDYGQPVMASIEQSYDAWLECDDGAKRFDRKVAGSHWIVRYPVGRSQYTGTDVTVDANGDADNADIAARLLRMLMATGGVLIPLDIQRLLDQMNGKLVDGAGWDIKLLEATGQQGNFVDRAKYLDAMMLRAAGITERAVTEGNFGTKAEAGEHADASLTIQTIMFEWISEQVNWHLSNQLLFLNFGTEDTARAVPNPLEDTKKDIMRDILTTMLTSESGAAMMDRIDEDELIEAVGLPLAKDLLKSIEGLDSEEIVDDSLPPVPVPGEEGAEEDTTTLNGAQIQAAAEICKEAALGTLPVVVVRTLLEGLGISTARAAVMAEASAAKATEVKTSVAVGTSAPVG